MTANGPFRDITDGTIPPPPPPPPTAPKLVKLRAKWDRADNRTRAAYVVGALCAMAFVFFVVLPAVFGSGGKAAPKETAAPTEDVTTTTAPPAPTLVVRSADRGTLDPFRSFDADFHPVVWYLAGDDVNRLFGVVTSIVARGANMCNLYMGVTGPQGTPIDLAKPAEWNWRIYDAKDYAGSTYTDGTPVDRLPSPAFAVPVFVNGVCQPLSVPREPAEAREVAKARIAQAAAAAQPAPATAGVR